MATLQSGKCFTVPTFFGMCCRSEWQERMYIYKWHEVDQTKHEIFWVHIVCNEIQVKVNLEITTFFFYLRFPYCPNFFWFGVVICDTVPVSPAHPENLLVRNPTPHSNIFKSGWNGYSNRSLLLYCDVHLSVTNYQKRTNVWWGLGSISIGYPVDW